MADGAHLGVTARRALGTILGGEPPPKEAEQLAHEEFALHIRSTEHALEDVLKNEDDADAYSAASRWLAKRFLLLMEQGCKPDDLWDAFKNKWPDDEEEAGGMTGFMHGWATNAALHTLKLPPIPNPALLTIEV